MSQQDAKSQIKPGSPIPTPENFPVVWEHPEDAGLHWTFDPVHSGEVVPTLMVSLSGSYLANGFSTAAEQYGMALQMKMCQVNGYSYTAVTPKDLPPLPVQKALGWLQQKVPRLADRLLSQALAKSNAETLSRMNAAADSLESRWEQEWKPAIRRMLDYLENLELEGADAAALLAYLNEALERTYQVWRIHFEIVMPATMAIARFDDFYTKTFADSGELDSQKLLQGIDNSFLAGDRALWTLSRKAAAQPELEAILLGPDLRAIPQALAASDVGRAFWAEMQAFLSDYGRRGQQSDGFREESWIENPSTALLLLRSWLRRPDHSPVQQQERLAAEREAAIAAARSRLAERDEATRNRFEHLLATAQMGMYLHEEHNFWIDQRTMYGCRRLMLGCARVLAENGVISQPSDIWHLTLDEVRAGLQNQPPTDLSSRIERRRSQLEHFRSITPPRAIGTMPLLSPPTDDPMSAMFSKMDGADRSGEDHARNELLGNAGSAGKVRGTARVIHDLADAHALRDGEILIARATMPPWTPIFSVAAGLVTETGGMLSHAAVVAREYGIPAVVGVADATARITTGRTVEVDGSQGVVRLL